MTGDELCTRFQRLAEDVFGIDHSAYLAARGGRAFWGLSIDRGRQTLSPLFGDPNPSVVAQLPYRDAMAGYRVDLAAARLLGVTANADVLLFAVERLADPPADVDALLLHELCHWLIDSAAADWRAFVDQDDLRAGNRLIRATDYEYQNVTRHDLAFCALLAAACRRAASAGMVAFAADRMLLLRTAIRFDLWDCTESEFRAHMAWVSPGPVAE